MVMIEEPREFRGVPEELGRRVGTSCIRVKSGEARLGQPEPMLVLEPSGLILA